ncbi:MAG: GreA/GreB family elongation factor [Ghiorsea sp.]
MNINKAEVLALIIAKLEADIRVSEQAVEVARDTATHKDCLGSSKYETMGTEASYLAQGQGVRLLELERALAYFKQLNLEISSTVTLSSLLKLEDEQGKGQNLWLAADAGGLKVCLGTTMITVITNHSPLGKSLIGKQAGDTFELNITGKTTCYEILDIA